MPCRMSPKSSIQVQSKPTENHSTGMLMKVMEMPRAKMTLEGTGSISNVTRPWSVGGFDEEQVNPGGSVAQPASGLTDKAVRTKGPVHFPSCATCHHLSSPTHFPVSLSCPYRHKKPISHVHIVIDLISNIPIIITT